jgi:hemoglobin
MTDGPGEPHEVTVYEFVGGEPFFEALVDRFYAGVIADPVLAPMYPPEDLAGAKHRLCGFLVQFWGGPDTYSQERGHPRLRMRHFPFAIGEDERNRWMRHMRAAVESADTIAEVKAMLLGYFENSATAMRNQPDR